MGLPFALGSHWGHKKGRWNEYLLESMEYSLVGGTGFEPVTPGL